jgi:hypothetical protein
MTFLEFEVLILGILGLGLKAYQLFGKPRKRKIYK